MPLVEKPRESAIVQAAMEPKRWNPMTEWLSRARSLSSLYRSRFRFRTPGAIINDFIYSAGGDSFFVTRNGRLSAIIQNYNTDFYRANKTRDTAKKTVSCIRDSIDLHVFVERCKEQCDTKYLDDSDTSLIGKMSSPGGVAALLKIKSRRAHL